MPSNRVLNQASSAVALTLFLLAGCNAIVGLDKIQVTDEVADPDAGASAGGKADPDAGSGGKLVGKAGGPASDGGNGGNSGSTIIEQQGGDGGVIEVPLGDCTSNQQCVDRLSGADAGAAGAPSATKVPAVCVRKPIPHCEALLSEDCHTVTGDYLNDQAIVIGSLFSTTGPTAATNLPRQQSAALAVEQINDAGGIPGGSTSANGRPLVMVSCDETALLVRAATHLVDDLHVPAIVGPNTSQDTLDVSTKVTVKAGTVVMSPTGVASSIANLSDDDLTWLMVPSDIQRAPLMINQINAIETQIKADDSSKANVKLGIVFRNDALGNGTRQGLDNLILNGKSIADAYNLNTYVKIDPYNGADPDQQAIVTKYLTFKPDIIVLAGTAEAITKVMVPLEAQWPAADPRPQYVLIDSTKVPELLTATTGAGNDDLRHRIRGTGITPGPTGMNTPAETFTAFQLDYSVRYGASATISGMGPAHDAAFAIGCALAATRTQEVSGSSVKEGLRKLAGGATKLKASGQNVLLAFQKLAAGEKITAVGTFGMLDWDVNGAVQGGTLEIWCIAGPSTKPAYASSGLNFDVKTQTKSGTYVQCKDN